MGGREPPSQAQGRGERTQGAPGTARRAAGSHCSGPAGLPASSPAKGVHLQVGPLDPPDAAGGVAPGLLGGEDELISRQLVGSCCFYLLCYRFHPGQMFLYFCPGGQEGIRKINNEMTLNGDRFNPQKQELN